MQSAGKKIRSLQELRRRISDVLRKVNADPALALRAAANPLLALEELGYDLEPGVRSEAERRIRFDGGSRERLEALEAQIGSLSPEPFHPDDPDELERILFRRLKLPPLPQRVPIPAEPRDTSPPARSPAGAGQPPLQPGRVPSRPPGAPDPLEAIRSAHPIVPLLLEYRAIQASRPPLATREVYERLRREGPAGAKLRIRARLQHDPGPE